MTRICRCSAPGSLLDVGLGLCGVAPGLPGLVGVDSGKDALRLLSDAPDFGLFGSPRCSLLLLSDAPDFGLFGGPRCSLLLLLSDAPDFSLRHGAAKGQFNFLI